MDAKRMMLMQAIENLHREDLIDFEVWKMCEGLMRLNTNWTAKDLADALHKDPSWVTRHLAPSKCIPAWQDALEAGRVGSGDCNAAAKVSDRDQHELLRMKLEERASRDDLERAVKRINRPKSIGSSVRLSRIKCPLPSGVTVVVSGAAIGIDEALEALASAGRVMKKARDEGLDAKTAQAVWRDKSKPGLGKEAHV